MYASDLKGGCIVHKASTIDCSDDANIVLLSKKDKSIKLYRDANTASAKYEAWKETYGRQIHDDLIFSKDSVAYQIGVKPLRKKDLRDFTPDDKIVNKFEEILRHNNVSDKENAFNRLVALFICKLVDESIKDEDDEVEFQYKQGTDTYETLQDRLQRLHRDGMEKFMREEILYVPADYPEWLFLTYTGSKRKSAIEDLRNTIRILKFYSNNEFTFKDVHNEELFYQNGKILVEMVQLFEKYRIVYPSKHQFLGDLFEQLLNKGFKQHLQLKNNSFTLLDRIGMNGGEIETLFVERIAQLLKPQGVAAVILPSSMNRRNRLTCQRILWMRFSAVRSLLDGKIGTFSRHILHRLMSARMSTEPF